MFHFHHYGPPIFFLGPLLKKFAHHWTTRWTPVETSWFPAGKHSSFLARPDRLWAQPSLYSVFMEDFLRGDSGRGVKLTT